MDQLPSDHFIRSIQFTRNVHNDVYPAIDPRRPGLSLSGRVAIITGASRGIGSKGIVPGFAKAGAKGVVLVATNKEKLMAVEADLNREYPAVKTLVMPTDISDPESVGRLFEKVKAEFGHADIVVNNAGVLAGGGAIHEEDPSEWWKNFEINVKGSFLVTQQFIKSLPSPSTQATIVNIVTSGAWLVVPFVSGYSISKLGQLQLTTYLAATYPNLTAIAIHPGMLDTDMMHPAFKRFDQNTPELLGGITVWACSKDAHFLTGKAIAANWDVDDLQARRSEIEGDKLLQMDLKGSFGKEQFE